MNRVEFRGLLSEESDYQLTDAIYDAILHEAEVIDYKRGEALIDTGTVDPSFYILYDGVVRGYIVKDGTEHNIAFGLPGSILISMHSFTRNEPALLRIEACTAVRALRISKPKFDALMAGSVEFSAWLTGIFTRRQYYAETKEVMMRGDAQWRYKWLKDCRPELLNNVPLKSIASYLGMSEIHISRIRKSIARGE